MTARTGSASLTMAAGASSPLPLYSLAPVLLAAKATLAIGGAQILVSGPITSGLQVWYPFDILATQWDPNFKQNSDTVNGLSVTDPGLAVAGTTRATSSKSSGKWQFEVTFSGASGWANLGTGICQASHAANQWLSFDTLSWAYWATGNVYTNSASVDTVSSWALGDVVGVLVDLTAGKLWFLKNGAVIGGTNGGNPATGTGGYTIATGVAWYPGLVFNSAVTDSAVANFGATALTYPVSGFTAWDTSTSDASGNNDAAILTGTTLPSLTTGKIGSGLSFNGSNSVAFTSLSPLNQIVGNAFSISAWVKTTATDGNILCLRNSTNGNTIVWLNVGGFNNSGTGKLGFTCRDDNANFGIFNVNGTTAINDGAWHHVCGTFGGSGTATLSVYVDGTLQNTGAFTEAFGLTFDTVWSAIGLDPSGSNPNMVGSIDDFRFYNRLLSSTEVNQIATQTEGFLTTGVGLYLLEAATALFAGTAGLTVFIPGSVQGSGLLGVTGSFAAQVTQQLAASAALVPAVGLQSLAGLARPGSATFAPAAAFSANINRALAAQATLAPAVGLAAAALVPLAPQTFAFASALTVGFVRQVAAATAALAPTVTLAADGQIPAHGAIQFVDPLTLPGSSTLAAFAGVAVSGSALFAATASLTASAAPAGAVSALLAPTVGLQVAQATLLAQPTALFAGASTLAVTLAPVRAAQPIAFAPAGALAASAGLLEQVGALLSATAGLAAATPVQIAQTSAVLAGTASLTAVASSPGLVFIPPFTFASAFALTSTLTARLQAQAAPLSGQAGLATAANIALAGVAAFTPAVFLTTTIATTVGAASALSAAFALSGTAQTANVASGLLAVSAGLSAPIGQLAAQAAATLAGASTLTADAQKPALGSLVPGPIAVASSLAATATVSVAVSALFGISASLVADARAPGTISVPPLAVVVGFAANTTLIGQLTTAFAGTAALFADAAPLRSASATLAGTAAMFADAGPQRPISATLAGLVALSAVGVPVKLIGAQASVLASLTAAPFLLARTQASLPINVVLLVAANENQSTGATLAGSSVLWVSAQVLGKSFPTRELAATMQLEQAIPAVARTAIQLKATFDPGDTLRAARAA